MGTLTSEDVPEGIVLWRAVDEAMNDWLGCPDGERQQRYEAALHAEDEYNRWRIGHGLPLPAGTREPGERP